MGRSRTTRRRSLGHAHAHAYAYAYARTHWQRFLTRGISICAIVHGSGSSHRVSCSAGGDEGSVDSLSNHSLSPLFAALLSGTLLSPSQPSSPSLRPKALP